VSCVFALTVDTSTTSKSGRMMTKQLRTRIIPLNKHTRYTTIVQLHSSKPYFKKAEPIATHKATCLTSHKGLHSEKGTVSHPTGLCARAKVKAHKNKQYKGPASGPTDYTP
jgi:hypothetical protein